MPKLSAGILLYRYNERQKVEIFLVHPGGPYWAKKDNGSWSLPKGEYEQGDDAQAAAGREFHEETGYGLPSGDMESLGDVRYNNKLLTVWAVKGSVDARRITSNTFTMEWPPKTGKTRDFPEVDRAGWFAPAIAKQKLVKGQVELVDRLLQKLGDASVEEASSSNDQLTLL